MRLLQATAFLVMALLVLYACPAWSAESKVLLHLSEFRNWLQLDYERHGRFSARSGDDLESTDHLFTESIYTSAAYSIYDPQLLNGHFDIDFGLNQNIYDSTYQESGTDQGTILEYSIDGTFFEHRPYPVRFFSSDEEREVQRLFSKNYELHVREHGLALALKNRFVPTNFRYLYRERETDGLQLDRVQTTNTYTFDALHLYKDISHSEVSFYHSDDDTDFGPTEPEDTSRITEYQFRNTMRWSNYPTLNQLVSVYRYRDETNDVSLSFKDWSESLLLQPGRALKIGFDYDNTSIRSDQLSRHEHKEHIWIEHKLYESLTSRLRFLNRKADYTAGMYKDVRGIAGLSYQKKLPRTSLLSLGYSYTRGRTDRDYELRQGAVFDERVTMELVGQNLLQNLDILIETIVVKNQDRTETYVENIDYTVLQYGRQTELLLTAGSQIDPDAVVSVDYLYSVDPGVRFSTTVHEASSSLSLLSNRYRIYAYMVSTDQEPLSDSTDEDRLYDLFTYTIGLVNTRRFATYGGEFVHYDSTTEKRQYVELFWRYRRYFRRNYLWLSFRDRYVKYDDTGISEVTDGSRTENQFFAGLSVRRRFFGRTMGGAGLEYLDIQGSINDRDELKLNLHFDMRVGRLELRFQAEKNWEWWENRRQSESRVFLTLRRYFDFRIGNR